MHNLLDSNTILHRHFSPYSHACHAYMCAHRGCHPLFTSSIEEHSAIRKSGTPTRTFLVAVLCSITMPHIIRQQHKWHFMGPAAEIMIHLFLAGHCTSTTWTLYKSIRVAFRLTWSCLYSMPRQIHANVMHTEITSRMPAAGINETGASPRHALPMDQQSLAAAMTLLSAAIGRQFWNANHHRDALRQRCLTVLHWRCNFKVQVHLSGL